MAEETRPFIGYRSAGRRPELQQDRRAAADAPLSALRGMASGVLGAPGDIESLIRMLPGLSERTVLPTSEDVEKRLPMPELNRTPTGRAFTTAGQLGGGFYGGPGAPLRAVAALPSAVSRAGRDFLMSTSPVHVVKPKGGNWLAGSVERAVDPIRSQFNLGAGLWVDPATIKREGLSSQQLEMLAPSDTMNRWLETKLAKYMRNEMATPEDPIRALAERGITHAEIQPTGYNVTVPRSFAGFPEEGMAKSPEAKLWEDKSDSFVNQLVASDITRGYPGEIEKNPWLLKVPPETRVYSMLHGADEDLGFAHLTDELRNAINPESGLPANLRLKYSDLEKVTVPQAVERVAKINDWRAAQKAEADMARAMNPATQVVKEYPEQGFKWVELRKPKDEIVTRGEYADPMFDIPPAAQDAIQNQAEREVRRLGLDDKSDEYMFAMQDRVQELSQEYAAKNKPLVSKALEDALKYEGETMGHCVGGYCPDVLEGRSKIYSLRDKKGPPHVTIEVRPGRKLTEKDMPDDVREMLSEQYGDASREEFEAAVQAYLKQRAVPDEIVQIKGKGNKAPKEDYLPAVQDFVRSGNFNRVGDIGNTGLIDVSQAEPLMKALQDIYGRNINIGMEKFSAASDATPDAQRFMTKDELLKFLGETPPAEGFSRGGQVRGYQAGGAVKAAKAAAKSLGELVRKYTAPQDEALMLAQQRAALPVEQGGLGLAAGNTPAERAAAMGFDMEMPFYHGTGADIKAFDLRMSGKNDGGLWGKGQYLATAPDTASSYALREGDGANVIPAYIAAKNPMKVTTGKDPITRMPDGTNTRDLIGNNLDGAKIKETAQAAGHDSVFQVKPNGEIGDIVTFNPESIRSRFAAFDPFRRTAATAALYGVEAPDLLAAEKEPQPQICQRHGARGKGYAEGGQVTGANFPTDDFDPDRIDAIVDQLHAMNAG